MEPRASRVDPMYSSGAFVLASEGWKDAAFKVERLVDVLSRNLELFQPGAKLHVADVGCGTGATTWLLHKELALLLGVPPKIDGYDVHPFLPQSFHEDVSFIGGEFSVRARATYDLVVLFDVLEHVPEPLAFLQSVSKYAYLLALHIPLDDSALSWVRNLPRGNLKYPGHLLVLSPADALNLVAFAGLRTVDFAYTPVFRAPSGRATRFQRLAFPARALLYWLSPYLLQRLLGGVSLMILAMTPLGLGRLSQKSLGKV
jgi:SAM-dependent methyltransferase